MDYQVGLYFLNFLTVVFSANNNFYTIHLDKMSFEDAQKACMGDAGFLTNMPDKEEISKILQAIADKRDQSSTTFWIGLKKDKKGCVQDDLPLKGFHWTVDNDKSTTFVIDKWKVKPEPTCTNILCGQLSVEYRGTVITSWGLAASTCKQKYPFICKHDGQNSIEKPCNDPQIYKSHDIVTKTKDPYTLQINCNGKTFMLTCSKASRKWELVGETETDISGICLECQKGYKRNVEGNCEDINECEQINMCKHTCINTEGSYECGCLDDIGNFHIEDSEICRTATTVSSFPSSTDHMEQTPTSRSVEQHPPEISGSGAEESNGRLFNILVPIIVAFLALVVLIVLIAAIARCCYIRRSKKLPKRKAGPTREAVALNGSDSVEKVDEKETT